MLRLAMIVLLAGGIASELAAQEPMPQAAEQLPPPRQWIPPVPTPPIQYIPYPMLPPPPPPRLDTRNAWALFAVDQAGRYRYRVVLSPYGSYYLYNGHPYLGTTTQQLYIQPKTSD
jgi:hypothetical protein